MISRSNARSVQGTSRRQWLKHAGAAVAGSASLMTLNEGQAAEAPPNGSRKRVLRLAHLTDVHVQPERGAEAGLAACLQHAQSLDDPPELVLNGGDSVMDVSESDAARRDAQGEVWRRTIKAECSLPVHSCIGNHDVWGWSKQESKTTGNEPLWGKAWTLELLGIPERYYSFDRAGWRFIALDSIFYAGGGYTSRLDDEQFAWLESTLAATPSTMPVLLWSHIPIISAASFFYDERINKNGHWEIPAGWMHMDAMRLKDLFARHPQVKLALSGHIHLADEILYNGVTYCCNGAVSGNWWKGKLYECDAGYGLVDLFDDGTFKNQYVTYGWQARE